jgi:hypothetical protein
MDFHDPQQFLLDGSEFYLMLKEGTHSHHYETSGGKVYSVHSAKHPSEIESMGLTPKRLPEYKSLWEGRQEVSGDERAKGIEQMRAETGRAMERSGERSVLRLGMRRSPKQYKAYKKYLEEIEGLPKEAQLSPRALLTLGPAAGVAVGAPAGAAMGAHRTRGKSPGKRRGAIVGGAIAGGTLGGLAGAVPGLHARDLARSRARQELSKGISDLVRGETELGRETLRRAESLDPQIKSLGDDIDKLVRTGKEQSRQLKELEAELAELGIEVPKLKPPKPKPPT